MLDKFLVLLERFVVAHELIAANSAKETLIPKVGDVLAAEERTVAVEEKAPAKKAPTRREQLAKASAAAKAKQAPASEPEPEEEPEEEAPKPKAGKKQGPDLAELRAEIKEMATHIAAGDSDECANEFDDLLDEFKVRTVTKLPDEDVAEFHGLAKEIVGKYYEFED